MGRWVNKALSAELFEPETLVHLLWSITEEQMKENTNESRYPAILQQCDGVFLFSPFSVNLPAPKKSLISRKCPLTYASSNGWRFHSNQSHRTCLGVSAISDAHNSWESKGFPRGIWSAWTEPSRYEFHLFSVFCVKVCKSNRSFLLCSVCVALNTRRVRYWSPRRHENEFLRNMLRNAVL